MMKPLTFEVSDGRVHLGEDMWLVHKLGDAFTISNCAIMSINHHYTTNVALKLKVMSERGGVATINVLANDLKKFCCIDRDSAEIKRVEYIMCDGELYA